MLIDHLRFSQATMTTLPSLKKLSSAEKAADRAQSRQQVLPPHPAVQKAFLKAQASLAKCTAYWQRIIEQIEAKEKLEQQQYSFHKSLAMTWDANPFNAWASPTVVLAEAAIRDNLLPVVMPLLNPLKHYFENNKRVLEIKASVLTQTGDSYLSRLCVDVFGLQLDWAYADAAQVADSMRERALLKNRHYHVLNLNEKGPVNLKESYDYIVGAHALDALPFDKMANALDEIHTLLKPGGIFFHLTDLLPHVAPCLEYYHYSRDQPIFLPYCPGVDGINSGLQMIDRQVYFEHLESQREQLVESEYETFKAWGQTSPKLQMIALTTAMVASSLWGISYKTQQIFGAGLAKVTRVRWFNAYLQRQVQASKWETMAPCQTLKGRVELDTDATSADEEMWFDHGQCEAAYPSSTAHTSTLAGKISFMMLRKI